MISHDVSDKLDIASAELANQILAMTVTINLHDCKIGSKII